MRTTLLAIVLACCVGGCSSGHTHETEQLGDRTYVIARAPLSDPEAVHQLVNHAEHVIGNRLKAAFDDRTYLKVVDVNLAYETYVESKRDTTLMVQMRFSARLVRVDSASHADYYFTRRGTFELHRLAPPSPVLRQRLDLRRDSLVTDVIPRLVRDGWDRPTDPPSFKTASCTGNHAERRWICWSEGFIRGGKPPG